MSGIAAVVSLNGSELARSDIERMANVLKPHGPDRQKILIQKNAAFVFCLHALTPEDRFEVQPILFADRFMILFDGRIDNRSELADYLGISTGELQSMPDSGIVLRLFDRWGEGAFERIVGVFAIIIMDIRDGRLLCARDQMGLRVLHYHRSAERFAVATTPQALFALSWVPRILNQDKVGDTLIYRGVNGEITHYQGIYRILPGTMISLRGAKFSKIRFWDPEAIPDVRLKSDDDYVEAFREIFHRVIKDNLRSIRTPCSTLTGGLDSSSIAVTAAGILALDGKKLNTFTAVPEAGFTKQESRVRYFDETAYCHPIVEASGNIVPHFIPPSKAPILQQIAREIRLGGFSPGIFNGLWGMDIVDAARSAGHNVMLGGDAGNLTMSYSGRQLYTELLLKGRWLKLIGELRASGDRWRARVREYVLAPMVPPPLFRRYKWWRRGGKPPWYEFSALNPEFADKSGVVKRAFDDDLPFDTVPIRNSKLRRISSLRYSCETADWFASVRAGFGVDLRMPAYDQRIVEFCFGIPQDQYLRGGHERWLIRRAMKDHLPASVLDNRKRGAQAADYYPRLTREREQIMEEVRKLAGSAHVASIVDLQRLNRLLENWPDPQPPDGSLEERLMRAIPEALGAAYFIADVTGDNLGR